MRKTRAKKLRKLAVSHGISTQTEFGTRRQGAWMVTAITKTNGFRAMKKRYLRGLA